MIRTEQHLPRLPATFCRPRLCRICCAPDNDDLISVQLIQDGVSIAQMLQELTEIEVMADKNLPQNVCLKCLDRLKNAYHLRRQCIDSDRILRREHYPESFDKLQPMVKLEIETLHDVDNVNEDDSIACDENEVNSNEEIKLITSNQELIAVLTDQEKSKNRPVSVYLSHDEAEYEILQQSEHYEHISLFVAQCCGCSESLSDKNQLLLHGEAVHQTDKQVLNESIKKTGTQYVCQICFHQFPEESDFSKHRIHIDARQLRCRECGLLLDDLDHMLEHLSQVHSVEVDNHSERDSDEGCNTDVAALLTLASFDSNQYKLVPTGEDFDTVEFTCFRCCGCENVFKVREQFELHSKEVHSPERIEYDEEMPYECSICYQRFAKKASLAYHRNGSSKRQVVCRICEGLFKGERSYRRHFLQHHSMVEGNELKMDVKSQQLSSVKQENDECSKLEDQSECESMREVEFIEDIFEDEELNSEDDELETSKPRRINKYLPTRQRKEMGKVPGNLLRIIEALDGYNIVEIMKERCCRCLEFFDTLDELNQHTEEHRQESQLENETSDKPIKYQCEFCLKTFDIALVYVVHKRIREQKQFYQCKLCDFVIDSESRLKNHMLHNEQHAKFFNVIREDVSDRYDAVQLPGVRCCGCGDYFKNDESLTEHSRTVHPRDHRKDGLKRGHVCTVCDKRCYNKSEVESHQKKNGSTIRYYCKLCEFETASEARMLKHLYSSIHNQSLPTIEVKNVEVGFRKAGTLRYCCFEGCNVTFCEIGKLQEHVNSIHKIEKESNMSTPRLDMASKWQCDCCYRFFRTVALLKQHQFSQRETKSYVCSICGAAKLNKTALTAHEMRHTGERPFACTVCDKRFASQTILTSHMKCHVPKQYECIECGEKFARGENLKRHIRHRHSEATYCCSYCPRKLKTREAQVLHERSHTGEKPFACRTEGCEKRYASITDRRRHEMASHTGERPHKCSYCVASFVRKRQLTIHERKHTGERPFVCNRCGKAFIDAPFLKKHSC
ncbi:zinc finger protein 568-like [Wyeomyia smithii]|uniref:zinc finger protein 568-like n=1 Tax=Wyeomyia smithii TaxID=174621 RepID=UPI002467D07E|nr:zinc finger protein 568-like [Wyeomyia smithii]